MKAAPFDYFQAATLDEVIAAFQRFGDEACILAGGQSLMPLLNMRLADPQVLIDINHIAELQGVSLIDGHVRIGALTRHSELARSADIAQHAPLLKLAAPHIAHPAIRNRGTIGGSLSHADPAAELPACVIASNARINLAGPNGTRTVAAGEFFQGIFETTLAAGEILTSVDIPLLGADDVVAFDELARRSGDYAAAGIAAKGTRADGGLRDLRIVFFSIADRPLLAEKTMAAVADLTWSDETAAAARAAFDADLTDLADDLHTSAATKKHLAWVLCGRAMTELAGSDAL